MKGNKTLQKQILTEEVWEYYKTEWVPKIDYFVRSYKYMNETNTFYNIYGNSEDVRRFVVLIRCSIGLFI